MKNYTIIFTIVFLFCLSNHAHAQELPKNLDEAIAKVNEVINIPNLGDLKNFNVSELPFGEAENLLKKKCEKNGGPEAYEKAKAATIELYNCGSGLVNISALQQEMEEARPKGDLDEVFKKYCRKKPILKNCIINFTNAIEPCLESEEAKNQKIVQNVVEKVLNFTCFKEGDRIALFVAAKGPECVRDRAQTIFEKCAKAENGSEAYNLPFNPANGLSALSEIKSLPSLIFDEKFCRNLYKFQTCTVAELETCEDPTPANLLDSIFNYIKKVTPCEKMLGNQPLPPQAQTMANSASKNFAIAAVLFAAFIVIFS